MDKTDRISFSKSFDLAGQNKVSKDPGQVYIAKTINIGRLFDRFVRFGADFSKLKQAREPPRTCPNHPQMIPEYPKIDQQSTKNRSMLIVFAI